MPISRVDPDAKPRGKPGQRPHRASAPAKGSPVSTRAKAVAALGETAFVPPQRTTLPAGDPQAAAMRQARAARQRCTTPRGIWA